ncbi:methyl-accepting chemotaxis protein, partial [Oscillospiraceae bacterium OttesenSCG-928-F05]|nr:methyl-accepting chemotaxis protein [Oscillospiraceae bacterium OttesenSCG-928-F05]
TRTNEGLRQVAKIAGDNAESMKRLSTSSETQSVAIAEITEGITQISAVVQANSATAEEAAASSEEMSAQARVLNNLAARFVLKDGGQGALSGAAAGYLGSGRPEPSGDSKY